MGCGCAKVAKNQKELLDDIKTERSKNEDEIKLLQAEIEKANTAATSQPTPGANPDPNTATAGAQAQPQAQPQPATTTPTPNPTPVVNVEELKKHIEGRNRFAQGLNDVEEELKRAEYNEVGALSDLVTQYFNITVSKVWDDVVKVVEEIKAFCSKNVKPKVGKTQLEIANLVDARGITVETESKDKNLEDPALAWLKEYSVALTFCKEELKKGEYNNLEQLAGFVDALNVAFDTKNVEDVRKHHEALRNFFRDNLKPK
jgi:hypothetical protein